MCARYRGQKRRLEKSRQRGAARTSPAAKTNITPRPPPLLPLLHTSPRSSCSTGAFDPVGSQMYPRCFCCCCCLFMHSTMLPRGTPRCDSEASSFACVPCFGSQQFPSHSLYRGPRRPIRTRPKRAPASSSPRNHRSFGGEHGREQDPVEAPALEGRFECDGPFRRKHRVYFKLT